MDKYEIRRPVAGDAPAIHRLIAAHDTEVLGKPDLTLDDVTDMLADPGLDLDRDAWLVHDVAGDLVGWGWACRKGDSANVDIEVESPVTEVAEWLWGTVLIRAKEIAAGLGHERVVADMGIHRDDVIKRAIAAEHGFVPATCFHRLRVDHEGPAPQVFLPGVTLHTGCGDADGTARAAHAVHQEGFAEHFGFTPQTYEEWAGNLESSATHDWSQLMLAKVHGEPAAMLVGSDMFVSDENCGYVRQLAVRPKFRGMGLGRYLLTRAFAADTARGRVGTILHVDTANTTPALGLYLSVGMRPVLVIDVWRRSF